MSKGIEMVSAYQSLAFLLFMPLVSLGVKYSLLMPLTFAGGFARIRRAPRERERERFAMKEGT